jgi:peptidyl-dipeptidase Dcp
MFKLVTRSLVLLFAALLAASMSTDSINKTVNANNLPADPNPLLAEWVGPYGGVPPFEKVQVALFKPALESAMAENLSDIDKIAKQSTAPTFDNTIVPLEQAGRSFDRVSTVYGIWSSTMSSPDFQAVQREMAPKLSEFSDQITQNEPLFKRIETIYNSPEKSNSDWFGSITRTLCAPAQSSTRKRKHVLLKSISNSPVYSRNSATTSCSKKTISSSL